MSLEQNRAGYHVIQGAVVNDPIFEEADLGGDYAVTIWFQPYEPGKELEQLDVFIPRSLFERRCELFRAGHRLYLEGQVDLTAPIMVAKDAWFWRGQGL